MEAKFIVKTRKMSSLKTESGAYFIDRDPKAFAAILKYLRTREIFPTYEGVSLKEVSTEALYFGIHELSQKLGGSDWCKSKGKEVLIVFPCMVEANASYNRDKNEHIRPIGLLALKLDGNQTYIISDAATVETTYFGRASHPFKKYSEDLLYST